MSSLISHTVACFIRLMGVLKILCFIAWLWLSCEFISDISEPVIRLSDPPVARKIGGIMHLNRSMEYKRGYATNNFIYEGILLIARRQKLSLCESANKALFRTTNTFYSNPHIH